MIVSFGLFVFSVLGMEPGASCTLGKSSTRSLNFFIINDLNSELPFLSHYCPVLSGMILGFNCWCFPPPASSRWDYVLPMGAGLEAHMHRCVAPRSQDTRAFLGNLVIIG